MTIRVALLGAGRIGRLHARTLVETEGVELYSVSDTHHVSAATIAEKYGCSVKPTNQAIIDPAVDAVLIATSTDTHADLIEACANENKAIFCEKPIDLNTARAKRCLEVISQTETPLMMGFNRRFDTHFAALKTGLQQAAIGEIEQIQIISRDPAPPPLDYIRVSGGLFRDMMVHDFDMARFLMDEEFVQVFAVGSALVDAKIGVAGDIDTAIATLVTASGKQCVISNSRRASYGYDQRIEVHASEGMLSANNPQPITIEHASAEGYRRGCLSDFFIDRYALAYASEIKHFVDWIADPSLNTPTGHDGLQALRLADAAEASMRSGQIVSL